MSVFATLVGRWTPKAPAVTYEGTTVTYGDLEVRALRAAGWLRGRGVAKGDVVAVKLDKELVFLDLHLGALAIGAVTLPLHTNATPREVADLTADAGAKLLVDDPAVAAAIAEHPPTTPADVGPDELAVLCYTSGTTGRPKGACITHRNLLATVTALHEAWRWSADDVLVHALPLFHIHGLFVAQHGAMYAGAHAVWLRKFRPDAVLEALRRATIYMGVPTHYARLLESDARPDLAHVRLFTSGSAPLPASAHTAFEQAFGHRIVERYGMTEVGIVLSNPYDGERRPGAVGFPLPGVRAKVTDAGGAEVPRNAVGEIRIAGPSVCAGYLNRPEATAAALGDGWMHTGDLGFVDDDGYFHVVGRESDMILSGGLNVYPSEVEAVLAEDPAVAEPAVFGIPDADLGERVCVAIVPRGPWDPDAIEARTRALVNAYKLPRRWFRVDALPRNAMGKVQKAVLRERYAVSVREARPDEAERIATWNEALCAETESFRLDPATVRAGVQRVFEGSVGARYFVAERGGEPAGQLMITREWSDWRDRFVWWIQSVYVPPDHRRAGVYTALHEHAVRQARLEGAGGLRLYVETANTAAMRTYERVGMTAEHYRMYEQMLTEEG
ncbi:MAG: GNAT family N-acetyltransferase [Alphaproteobacteria bacterium]|nr:GNAT family N-acetyltransferase [Alphaproteobacteria bacterium]